MWVEHLAGQPPSADAWGEDRDDWLREAVLRLEGVAGLERIARESKNVESFRAWCDALVAQGDWAAALRAYDAATTLVDESQARGEFLDGAALAARELGRADAAERLHAAWLGAPSLVRMQRWLGAGSPSVAVLARRARDAIERCPAKARRQLAPLYVLTGNVRAGSELLAQAPGLGWSNDEHPAHVLFPAYAGLLAEGTGATLSAVIFSSLEESPEDLLAMDWAEDDDDEGLPTLATPTAAQLIRTACAATRISVKDREAVLEAMRVAAGRRGDGIVGGGRRR
jgi:hypothetical protein